MLEHTVEVLACAAPAVAALIIRLTSYILVASVIITA